jgi:GxxExxY protein
MTQSKFEGKHSETTDLILNAFYKVHRFLGYGFNEKVYENSLAIELRKAGLHVVQQQEIEVFYEGQLVGTYFADMIVNDVVMLELKAVKQFLEEHHAQLLNYLKATRMEVGLLLNFGPAATVKRFAFDNELKGTMDWMKRKKCE